MVINRSTAFALTGATILIMSIPQTVGSQVRTTQAVSKGALYTEYSHDRTGCSVSVKGGTSQATALAWLGEVSALWAASREADGTQAHVQPKLEALVRENASRGLASIQGAFGGVRLATSWKSHQPPSLSQAQVSTSAQDMRTGASVIVRGGTHDTLTRSWLGQLDVRTPPTTLESLVTKGRAEGLLLAASSVETELGLVHVRAFWAEEDSFTR